MLLDNNNFTGDTNVLCDLQPYRIVYLTADCAADPATDSKEIACECCDLCCSDDNATCNNLEWSGNLDPIWEYGYNRGVYSFSQELIPPSSGGRWILYFQSDLDYSSLLHWWISIMYCTSYLNIKRPNINPISSFLSLFLLCSRNQRKERKGVQHHQSSKGQ